MSVVAGNGAGTPMDGSPPTRSPHCHPAPPRCEKVAELAELFDALYAVNVEPLPAAHVHEAVRQLRKIIALARWYEKRLLVRVVVAELERGER